MTAPAGAIVFDLDGTLIDSAPDIRGIANALLAREGRPALSLAEVRGFIGHGAGVFITRLRAARDLPDADHARLLADFVAAYDDAVHLTHHEAVVGRDAEYKHAAISVGGDVVRMDSNVHYAGPGGSANMLGLYFADAGQHIEHRLFVDHGEPQCKSNANYRGALQGQGAHTVWVGNVLIREAAGGIETYEENRNLILTDGCHADSVPNLEIETGEIAGAGHASATGRFDDNQLFYLRSRGIEENEARRLVVHGFFNDLIRQIGVEALDEKLREVVEDELEKNVLQAF